VKITTRGEVEDTTGRIIPGLFAAGELVGGVFYQNYWAAHGLNVGLGVRRIAGRTSGIREGVEASSLTAVACHGPSCLHTLGGGGAEVVQCLRGEISQAVHRHLAILV